MKIIAFGDIHEQKNNIERIKGLSAADMVIITGDLTNFGGTDKARNIIECVIRHSPGSLLYALAGNMDQQEVHAYFDEQGINLHGIGVEVKGIGIFGVGGSNPTPFKTPNEYSEDQIESFIQKGFDKVKHLPRRIFVSHTPPCNTKLDRVGNGVHVGSTSVRKFIETFQPDLCLTGHIHEAAGTDSIGETLILNPGMLKDGGFIEVIENCGKLEASLRKV